MVLTLLNGPRLAFEADDQEHFLSLLGTRSLVTQSGGSELFDIDPQDLLSGHPEWKIDGQPHLRASDRRSFTQLAYCSNRESQQSSTHIVKLLPMTASMSQCEQFERQAYLAMRLYNAVATTVSCRLDSAQPILVYPRLSGLRADDWFYSQAAWTARPNWIALGQTLLLQLVSLHKLGYAHGQIRPEHVWIGDTGEVNLLGLGNCEPVGNRLSPRFEADRFDSPETRFATSEVSSAQDIYSAAVVIDLISGGLFSKTPIGRCMQAIDPYDRPTSVELVQLFESYRIELQGNFVVPAMRAA